MQSIKTQCISVWQASLMMHKAGKPYEITERWTRVTKLTMESDDKVVTECHTGTRGDTPSLFPLSAPNKANKSKKQHVGALCHFPLSPSFYSPVNISPTSFSPAGPGCHICSTSIISTCSCHSAWHYIPKMEQVRRYGLQLKFKMVKKNGNTAWICGKKNMHLHVE